MIDAHGFTEGRQLAAFERSLATVAPCFFHQARLIEKLVTLKRLFLVPRAAAGGKAKSQAFAPAQRSAGLARLVPMSDRALCGVAWHRRTPVLLRRRQEVSP